MAGYAYSHVMQNIIKNTELYNRCRTQPISKEIAARRWSFLGHVLRMPSGAPPQVALDFAASGALRGRIGRPRTTLLTTLSLDCWEKLGIDGASDATWPSPASEGGV
eukprot:scpid29779/ scgid2663/ 